MDEQVDEFLANRFGIHRHSDGDLRHYASKYYDPVKAREYYLKTRELKGREPALSKESLAKQREATSYVRNEINSRKQADLDKLDASRDQLSAQAKSQAEAHKARMEKIQAEGQAAREAIVKKLTDHIEKIKGQLKIPANASPKLRAYLEKQQERRLRSATGSAKSELSRLSESLSTTISNAQDEYRSFRDTNTETRRLIADKRRKTVDTYRNDLKTETENIKKHVR
jgi:hypothetical protein